jgi:hypothetical protein
MILKAAIQHKAHKIRVEKQHYMRGQRKILSEMPMAPLSRGLAGLAELRSLELVAAV